MVLLLSQARSLLTDSGGLQKEAFTLGIPCTTLRAETEWVETLEGGWNVLAPETFGLEQKALRKRPSGERITYYGNGHTAAEVLAALTH
jgi:UDP-N-acetylglucosamine 2-epimerase (non-hydrolysing)